MPMGYRKVVLQTSPWAQRITTVRNDLRRSRVFHSDLDVSKSLSMTSKILISPKISGLYLCWSINFDETEAAGNQ
jgi:hypothetical protein